MIFAYSIAKPNGKDLRFRMMVIAQLQIPGGNPHRPQEPLHQKKRGVQLALRWHRRQDSQPWADEKHPKGFHDRAPYVFFLFGVAQSPVNFQNQTAP